MTTEEKNKTHQKHTKLPRPTLGDFGRIELGILGTPCGNIQKLAKQLIQQLPAGYKIAYVDADHKAADAAQDTDTALAAGATLEFTDKISFRRLDFKTEFTPFQQRVLLQEQDLILINGNHFKARAQVVVVDPAKPLAQKLDKLTDVQLLLLKEKDTPIPDYLQQHLSHFSGIPVLYLEDETGIAAWVKNYLQQQIPKLHGLVLAGGQSSRMQQDKGGLSYHGTSQRAHVYAQLKPLCEQVYVSCNSEQAPTLTAEYTVVPDQFLGLGPLGGILSAFQSAPDAAWLTVACDLPFLSEETLAYLVQHRNPSKMATAFLDPKGEFPEPLVTIWEPRSYPMLLQFLSQGYTCPRKALINSDVQLLTAPDVQELQNINYPAEYEAARQALAQKQPSASA